MTTILLSFKCRYGIQGWVCNMSILCLWLNLFQSKENFRSLLLFSLCGFLSFENKTKHKQTTLKTAANLSATFFTLVHCCIRIKSRPQHRSIKVTFHFVNKYCKVRPKLWLKWVAVIITLKIHINTLFERNIIYFQDVLFFDYCLFNTH